MRKNIIIVFLLLFLVSGCATTIKPAPPQSGVFKEPVAGKTTIYAPLSVNLKILEQLVNQNFPKGQLISGSDRSGNSTSYEYHVYRNENITISASDGKLSLNVPIYAKAKGTKVICGGFWHNGTCYGGQFSEHANTEARADVIVDLKLYVNPDYTVAVVADAKIELRGRPHLHLDLFGNLIRINIDITDAIKPQLEANVPKLTRTLQAEIDAQLKSINVKRIVEEYWPKLQKPIEAGDAWVQFIPQKVVFHSFHSDSSRTKLMVGIGVQGNLKISLTKPDTLISEIPPVENTSQRDATFDAIVPLHSAFLELEKELNNKVSGLEFRDENNYIKINAVTLNGAHLNGKAAVLIGVNFSGGRKVSWYDRFLKRVDGTLYFVAAPEYDSANRIIYVRDFEMTSETSSAILNAGLPWIIRFKKDEIEKNLKYELGPQIDKISSIIKSELSSGKDIGAAVVFGTLKRLDFGGFYLNGNEIELYINASGGVSLEAKSPDLL